jgi:hypothetical protein
MAVGQLSADQAAYAAQVASATGLDTDVVRAWIGAESGWGVTKPTHNYLTIGPGRQYATVDQAATAAAHLVGSSSNYAGIRSAIPAGPDAQVQAIQASPWDAAHYGGHRLADVYSSVVGAGSASSSTAAAGAAVPVSVRIPGTNIHLPGLGDLTFGAATDVTNRVVAAAGGAMLGLLFSAAALALIGLGLSRLTGNNARDLFGKAQQTTGQAAQVAQIAALA